MALEDNFEEKTEEATDERKKEFRDRGEVAQSREFTSVFALLGSLIFFSLFGYQFIDSLQQLMRSIFTKQLTGSVDINQIKSLFQEVAILVGKILLPLFGFVFGLAVTSGLFQTRFSFSFKKLTPNFGKLNPLEGMKRFVSWQAAMELTKSIAKILTVGLVSYSVLKDEIGIFPKLSGVSVAGLWGYWGSVMFSIFFRVLLILLIISGIDYFYNWISLRNKMRMTKQSVKDEQKNREGDPLIKRRIRDVQRQLSRNRMIQEVEKSTVLITNPTHFAVGLQYEPGMRAPILVSKGQDFLALKLKEIAKEKGIPIVENKALARTLYKMIKVGQEIPESLYKVVSEVIAYVYRLKNKMKRT